MPTCKKCRAEIRFIRTPKGKATPIDAKPKLVWVDLGPEDEPRWKMVQGHESHFATCPAADSFRKES